MSPPDDEDPLEKARRLMPQAADGKDKIIRLAAKREEKARKEKDRKERADNREKGKEFKPLPDDCPVRPLGVNRSDYYFLDAIDQLIVKPADKMGQKGIDDLFKDDDSQRWAEANYPRFSMWGNIIGIDRDRLSRGLMAKCGMLSKTGIFDPSGRIRGDGAWRDELGHLVWHCGDVVLTADADGRLYESKPSVGDQYIYPKGTAQLRPLADTIDHRPGTELLTLLESWNWKRGRLDALLMLGWIVLAPVGGAMPWRPALWITGDMATGKSTLQELIRGTQGGHRGLIQAADATGAGIWQALKFRSLPVALDEIEADTDNSKKQSILTLMRISASGDRLKRGGADHEGVEFNAYSAFMFSSINMLPLAPQDMSRLAMLELSPLPQGRDRPRLDPHRLAQIGAALRRRVVMAWPQWEQVLAPWQQPLEREFGKRTADTFGYLLAMADLALNRELADTDSVAEVIEPLLPSLREWRAIAGQDHELMLNHLTTWQLEPWDKGRKITIGQLVYWASDRSRTPARNANDEEERYGKVVTPTAANGALRMSGLAVIRVRAEPNPRAEYLAIAFRHAALRRIFRGTKWQDGTWRQSAGRFDGAHSRKVKFEGWPEGAVLVPTEVILGAAGEDDYENPHSPAP